MAPSETADIKSAMPRKFHAIATVRLCGAPDARASAVGSASRTRQNIADSGRQSEDAGNGAAIGPEDEEITADHAVDLETDQPGYRGASIAAAIRCDRVTAAAR